MPIHVYILENDLNYRREILNYIEIYQPILSNFLIIPINNYLTFVNDIPNLVISDFDIFFLDIDLNTELFGINLAKKIRLQNRRCSIIFISSKKNEVLSAINSHVLPLSYIIKDLTNMSELKENIQSIFSNVEDSIRYSLINKTGMILLHSPPKTIYLNENDIFYIESNKGARGKLSIYTNREELFVDGTIKNIKTQFTQDYFCLSLRSYIINLFKISSINMKKGIITFLNHQELFLGERILIKIKKELKEKRQFLKYYK